MSSFVFFKNSKEAQEIVAPISIRQRVFLSPTETNIVFSCGEEIKLTPDFDSIVVALLIWVKDLDTFILMILNLCCCYNHSDCFVSRVSECLLYFVTFVPIHMSLGLADRRESLTIIDRPS